SIHKHRTTMPGYDQQDNCSELECSYEKPQGHRGQCTQLARKKRLALKTFRGRVCALSSVQAYCKYDHGTQPQPRSRTGMVTCLRTLGERSRLSCDAGQIQGR